MPLMDSALELDRAQKPVSDALLKWWTTHQRSYPWRETKDPYRILIAEALLHRTRADQVYRVYGDFMRRYPTIVDLASAKPREVLEVLRPLGLRWRTRKMLAMAKVIHSQFHDEIPRNLDQLKSLPGVSDYIAAAVQCFAFGVPTTILDTNTVRVTGRISGTPISDSARRKAEFRILYSSLQDASRARDFNLAMLDLAALLCKPSHPECQLCPLLAYCQYGRSCEDA